MQGAALVVLYVLLFLPTGKRDDTVLIDGIVAVGKPVTRVDVCGSASLGRSDGADDGGVSVTEDAVVECLLVELLAAMDDNAFFFVALVFKDSGVFLDMALPAAAAPMVGDAEGHPLGQDGEHLLVQSAAEYLADKVVLAVLVAEPVTVADKEFLSIKLEYRGVVVHGDVHLLLTIAEHPHVMVADKVMQLDTCIGQFCHLANQPHMSFRDDISVGEPEVEHITQEDDSSGVFSGFVQSRAQLPLP